MSWNALCLAAAASTADFARISAGEETAGAMGLSPHRSSAAAPPAETTRKKRLTPDTFHMPNLCYRKLLRQIEAYPLWQNKGPGLHVRRIGGRRIIFLRPSYGA